MTNPTNNRVEEETLVYHKRWLTLYRMIMRTSIVALLGMLLFIDMVDSMPTKWWLVILVVLILGRIRQDWKRWRGQVPALKLYPDGIELPVFGYEIGRLPWSEVSTIQEATQWGLSKQLKIVLNDPEAVIARESRLLRRWRMSWLLRVQGTPFAWSSSMIEPSHEAQYALLNDYHQGNAQFSSLSNHLIDDAL